MTEAAAPVTKNIFQRLAAVAGEVDYIQKLKAVSTGGEGSYKAVTHDQVTGTLRNAFLKHGVLVYPVLAESRTVPTGAKTKAGADHVRFEAVYDVHFVNVDAGDEVVVRVPAHGVDSGDKAPGKTVSYAVKYAMLKVLLIETGENDESRFGSDDNVDVDTVVETINGFSDAKTRPALRELLKAALFAAQGDAKTTARYTEAATKAAEKLPAEIRQPTEKVAPNDGPVETVSTVQQPSAEDAAAPPIANDEEPRASVGLVKSIRNLIETKGLDEAAVKKITKGAALETMSKSQAAKVLAAVSAS